MIGKTQSLITVTPDEKNHIKPLYKVEATQGTSIFYQRLTNSGNK